MRIYEPDLQQELKTMKTGFIGGGKMAEAIIAALIKSRTVGAHEIFACDIAEKRRRLLKRRFGINVYSRNHSVVADAEIVFLAVKPQNMDEVLTDIAPDMTRGHLVISIAAGKTIEGIEGFLPQSRVVRVMPNLPCLVAEGMSVFCLGARAMAKDRKTVANLLASFGKVLELGEDLFDAVTALSGSGPAFFCYVLNAMVEAGVGEGLDRKSAVLLAEQTMLGTSRLLLDRGMEPSDLIAAVASAKGTTAAGLAVLEKSSVDDAMAGTIRAAAQRSKELSL